MKGQKGITLVALIITIIVLLILALVTIASFSDSGIFGHAHTAVNHWDNAQKNEQEYVDWANGYIEESVKKKEDTTTGDETTGDETTGDETTGDETQNTEPETQG